MQKNLRIFLMIMGVYAVTIFTPAQAHEKTLFKPMVRKILSEGIIPAYSDLDFVAKEFKNNVSSYCRGSGLENNAKESFKQLVMLWAGLEWISFGPVAYNDRRLRFTYYPDKHRVGGRQLRKLIASEDKKTVDMIATGEASYALQGLSALDAMLYSYKINKNSFSCKVAVAISKNLSNIASELYRSWNDEFGELYGSTMTEEQAEVLGRIMLKDIGIHLQKMQEYKLGKPLNKGRKVKTNAVEYKYSELSLTALLINLQVSKMAMAGAFDKKLHQIDAQRLTAILKKLTESIESAPYSLKVSLKKDKKRIQDMYDTLAVLRAMYKKHLSILYGVNTAFNSLDGD